MESPGGVSSTNSVDSSHWHHLAAGEGSHQEVTIDVPAGPSNGGDRRSGRGAGQEQELPDMTKAEEEIRIYMWLKEPGNEVYKEASEWWETKYTRCTTRLDNMEMQVNSVKNEIYQLIGFYTVFQGVILTAVAQSTLLVCHNWWTTFYLSVLASLVAIVGVIQKFTSIQDLERTIISLKLAQRALNHRIVELGNLGPKFKFKDHDYHNRYKTGRGLKVSVLLVVATLFLFSGLFLASVYQILCDSGLSVQETAPSQP